MTQCARSATVAVETRRSGLQIAEREPSGTNGARFVQLDLLAPLDIWWFAEQIARAPKLCELPRRESPHATR